MKKLSILFFIAIFLVAGGVMFYPGSAGAETFLSAGIGAEQITFSNCSGDCDLLKNNSEAVISLRMGKYWNRPLAILPVDIGVAGTISQTGHMHVDNKGIDERTGDISLLLRYRLEKFSLYGGYGVGSVITATNLGDCNHGARFLTAGVEGKVSPQSATWYMEYRQYGTHHDFMEGASEEITTREHVKSMTAGVRYTF